MRLLNTETFEFGDFYDDAIPPYAILSHRWGDDEVSYHDFLAHRKRTGTGFSKIAKACNLAANDSLENGGKYGAWIWIDTCCINKESSAELSEAINSMWRWYQNAAVCYAYLFDVPEKPVVQEWQSTNTSSGTRKSLLSFKSQFRKSQWFTRGWTLQELLAPQRVEFMSTNWTRIGNKVELSEDISLATGIRQAIFLSSKSNKAGHCSVAEKLSWVANRQTSRTEDMAYCLFGLLDINMPLLYGEGNKAFVRLQEELVRSSDDESIFAWSSFSKRSDAFKMSPTGSFRPRTMATQNIDIYPHLFADSPSRFASCGNIEQSLFDYRPPFEITNKGLRMDSVVIPLDDGPGRGYEFLVPLNCVISNRGTPNGYPKAPLALHLTRVDPTDNIYIRKGCVDLNRPEFAKVLSSIEWKRARKRGVLDHSVFSWLRFGWLYYGTNVYFRFIFLPALSLAIYRLLGMTTQLLYVVVNLYLLIDHWTMPERRAIFISRNPLISYGGFEIGTLTVPESWIRQM